MSIDYKEYHTNHPRGLRAWQWFCLGGLFGFGISVAITFEKSWKEHWKAFYSKPPQTVLATTVKPLPVPQEPKFDFYNVLPEMEVTIPETTKIPAPVTSTATPVYILQVGAFKSQPEAERLKVELALLGLQAGIETSTMPNGTIWYRVKLGPYAEEATVDGDKQRLQANGIRSFKVKIEQ